MFKIDESREKLHNSLSYCYFDFSVSMKILKNCLEKAYMKVCNIIIKKLVYLLH